jgi:predicted enzyme related to lactoylglutathione lyase
MFRHFDQSGQAASLAGKMLVPSIAIPTGTFAWFADPEGNTIGLFKPS